MVKIEDCVRDQDSPYTLMSICPRNGKMREVHAGMKIGGIWLFSALNVGRGALCLYEANDHPGYLCPVSLSKIESVVDDRETKTIVTRNTIYMFERDGV